MKRSVCISVINDLSGDQRLHRVASCLHEAGFEVEMVGRLLPDSRPVQRVYRTHRMKLWFRKGKAFYLEYNIRLFFYLMRSKADIFNANDLDTLLANYLAARFRRKSLVYDSHEFFTEVPELIGRPWTRRIWLLLERWILPRLKQAYTVNQSLSRIYSEKYGISFQVIRNLPLRRTGVEFQAKENIILYQGALNLGRGIELMIDSMEHLPEYQLWIVGKGDLTVDLQARAKQKKLQDRIKFHGFIPLEDLHQITQQAKIGLSIEEDRGLNYHYASPNKVYDYIQAAVPVLVSDLPEMKRLVSNWSVGAVLTASERNPAQLAAKIREMATNLAHYQQMVANCQEAAATLHWEKEKERLKKIYQNT